MANIGDPITPPIPAVGTSGTTYAAEVNAFLTEVKDRLEADVPRASLAPGDLDLDGEALQNAEYLGLAEQSSTPSTPVGTLQSFDDELYWVSVGGSVKITDNGNVNIASVGGITGDYGGVNPAQLRFVDADQEFYAYDDFANLMWAGIGAGWFDVFATPDETVRARLQWDGASSIDLNLPDDLPGAVSMMTLDASGNMNTVNYVEEDYVIHPASYVVDYTADIEGAAIYGAKMTMPHYWINGATGTNGDVPVYCPVTFPLGATLVSATLYIRKLSDATQAITFSVNYNEFPTPGGSIGINAVANNAAAPGYVTIPMDCTETVSAGRAYYFQIQGSDSTPNVSTDEFHHITYKIRRQLTPTVS